MGKDEDMNAWDDALDDSKAPQVGASKEMLRKALALNPAMRKLVPDSTVLLERIESAKRGKPMPTEAAAIVPSASAAPNNLTDVLRLLRSDLDEQKKAIAAERALLDQREKALLPALCDRMIDAVLAIDPNMTSPKTAFILKQEKPFLDAIGFSTQKLVERESRR